jgi:pimeloyl-ACP methyl ester carboxylesterase
MKNTTCFRISIVLLFIFYFFFGLPAAAQTSIPYGDNKEAGQYISLNGVKHYYEVYGKGAPLLLIHGNSTGIKGWSAQIDFFSKKYKVYAIDCRGRGKSDLGTDSLSYKQQAIDMAAFIRLMKLDSVSVVGKSDGGIIAIMLGIYYPEHIKKIVSFSANMVPDTTALYPEAIEEVKKERLDAEKMLVLKDITKNWDLIRQRNRMMEFQPHITAEDLHKIKIPVLVISSDRDVIKEEHTLFIYKNIPNAHLAIISGETHRVPRQNPDLFNAAVDKFLSEPFKGYEYRFK